MASSARPMRVRPDKSYAESSIDGRLEGDDDDDFTDDQMHRDENMRRTSRRKRVRSKSFISSSQDEFVEPPEPRADTRTRSGRIVKRPVELFSPGSTPPDNKKSFSRRLSTRKAQTSAGTSGRTPPSHRNLRSSMRLNSVDNEVQVLDDEDDEYDSEDKDQVDEGYHKRAKKEPRADQDNDIDVAAIQSPKESLPLRVRLKYATRASGETVQRNGLPNGKNNSAKKDDHSMGSPDKNDLSPNADSGESAVPIRRTRSSAKKKPLIEEELIDGNDDERVDGNDEDFHISSDEKVSDDEDEEFEAEEEEPLDSGQGSDKWIGPRTRNRNKRTANRSSPPSKRTRRETRNSAPSRKSRRTTAEYHSGRKSYPSRSVRPRTARRPTTRAAERGTSALDTYRPSRNTMHARDFYEQQSSSGETDSSDDEFIGSAIAGKSVMSPRPNTSGDGPLGTGAQPDFLSNPMALIDDYGMGRARPGRYVRRRNRKQQPSLDPYGIDSHGKRPGQKSVGIEPIQVDLSLTWDGIGGLDHHIRALKEMVFLPLMYPEVFEKFKMEPPKGVLFYGPPGTGKTLCARTLAASCGGELVEEEVPPVSADALFSAANAIPENSVAPTATAEEVKVPDGGSDAGTVRTSATPANDVSTATPVVPDGFIVRGNGNEGLASASGIQGVSLQVNSEACPTAADAMKNNVVLNHAAGLLAGMSNEQPAIGSALSATVGKSVAGTDAAMSKENPAHGTSSSYTKKTRRPRVAFFMRNGADCLSKWVGEAERQLRMTFEAAKKHQPAIIFFDEIDGLAPVRSSRQDQIHSSIVSTLLGLMDGLDSRGKIVVIGATNRVDAIDPALRRPGRFDRELIFTLPNGKARRRILDIQTADWKPSPPPPKVLDAVAARTVGYCGADIRALCSEATLRALRRRYPQIYESQDKLLIDVDSVRVSTRDFLSAMNDIVPASHRSARTHARPIPPRLTAVLSEPLQECIELIQRIFPQGITPGSLHSAGANASLLGAVPNGTDAPDKVTSDMDDDLSDEDISDEDLGDFNETEFDNALGSKIRSVYGKASSSLRERPVLRPRLLLCGRPGLGQTQLGPALLHFLEGCPVHAIDMPSLHINSSARSPEEALVTAVREACRAAPSVLYLPHLHLWWKTAHESLRTTLIITLRDIPADLPLLFLATAEEDFDSLPSELTELFAEYVRLLPSKRHNRVNMFAPLIEEAVACPKVTDAVLRRRRVKRRSEVLPKAPPPPPKVVTPEEGVRQRQEDDRYLRDLRMSMRNFVEGLLRERKFKVFWLPVDPSIAPDYYNIVQNPMDISKIAAQIDKGMYPTVLSMVKDFDLMVKNAIDYNPAHTEEGAAILRRAHGLVDIVHAWVDNLNPVVVERCNRIVAARIAKATQEKEKLAKELEAKETASKQVPANASAQKIGDPSDERKSPESMDVDEQAQPNNVPQVQQSAPVASELAQNRTPDGGKRSRRLSSTVPSNISRDMANGIGHRPEGLVDAPYIRPNENKVAHLRRLLVEVTSGISVDGLEGLHVRCATLLHKFRRSRDRATVVDELTNIVTEAREDPAVVGQLVE